MVAPATPATMHVCEHATAMLQTPAISFIRRTRIRLSRNAVYTALVYTLLRELPIQTSNGRPDVVARSQNGTPDPDEPKLGTTGATTNGLWTRRPAGRGRERRGS